MADSFRPALLVVDMQEDFCPPNGSLAVPEGRDVIPAILALLDLPSFVLRIATKDWHPADHISFAANHPGRRPFEDTCTVANPQNAAETYETRLWPTHCVQHSPGARLVPELASRAPSFDRVVEKGTHPAVETYSAFYAPLRAPRVGDTGLAGLLRDAGVTTVYVVGLAADYCVRCTALDAVAEGFETLIVEEGTRAVDPAGWPACRRELEAAGVKVVGLDSEEVRRLRRPEARGEREREEET